MSGKNPPHPVPFGAALSDMSATRVNQKPEYIKFCLPSQRWSHLSVFWRNCESFGVIRLITSFVRNYAITSSVGESGNFCVNAVTKSGVSQAESSLFLIVRCINNVITRSHILQLIPTLLENLIDWSSWKLTHEFRYEVSIYHMSYGKLI